MPASTSVHIEATPSRIWEVLTAFNEWGDWNTFIPKITSHADRPGIGTNVTFTAYAEGAAPATYTCRFVTWDPRREFAWLGGPMPLMLEWLARGYHWFKLIPEGSGTRFIHGEELQGLFSYFMPQSMLDNLTRSLEGFNKDLRQRCEGK